MLLAKLLRKKVFNDSNIAKTKLSRSLNVYDITSIGKSACSFFEKMKAICLQARHFKCLCVSKGIGITLTGVYIVGGEIITNYAGPAVILAFLLAGLATSLSAMVFAELSSIVPRSGSAYVYIYVSIGEFVGL